jgi:SWI/SNF chromatin-remodeling complex subunit SWI1
MSMDMTDECCMADGMGMGMGMMEGHGRDHGMGGLGPIWLLDLKPEQRIRLNKIQLDLRKQHWSLAGKNIDSQALLYDLYAAERPDPKKIGQVYAAMFDIRRQMIEAQIDASNRARDILTREQLEKLRLLKQEDGMGAHHGMMHR